jgi:HK97 family phage major capsid protein
MSKRIEELREHLAGVIERQKEIDAEYAGEVFPREAQDEFDALRAEQEETKAAIKHLEERQAVMEELANHDNNIETDRQFELAPRGRRVVSRVPDDPTDVVAYRNNVTNLDDLNQAYKDGSRKLLERFRPSHPHVSREEAQNDIDGLIEKDTEVALRMITTSTVKYRREFAEYCRHGVVGPEMLRTASLTTTAGGYAVPVELDTTLILTNAGVVNPVRNIARVRQTNVNTVEFLNTTGIVAAFGAEVTEASDNAPTLAQPTVNIEKAFAFVPASIEIFEDWAAIQPDMALAFADAKNQLESAQFLTGLGHASHAPQGLIAVGGATAVVSTATTAVFAVADLYSLENALSPRYRPNATFVANRAAFQKIRQFDTAGGANLWVQLPNGNPTQLLGYDAAEWSNYSSATTTSGSTIATLGDFSYFAIVDRVGMSVEFIPHLFGGSSRFPTGQRGLYMWWRTSSQVLSPTLQANSAFVSLKVL